MKINPPNTTIVIFIMNLRNFLCTSILHNVEHDNVRSVLNDMDTTTRDSLLFSLWSQTLKNKDRKMTSILSEYPMEQTDHTQAYFHQILVAYCKDVKRNQPFAREKMQDLLKAGLNINYCVDNKTFLSYLVQSTSMPIIKWFIDLGATAPYILFDACCGQTDSQWHKRQRDEQNTVIRTTFYHGLYDNTDTFRWLVKHFPDQLHVLHPNGMNLLQWVASEGSLDKIKCVLPYMVDTIHTKSEDGSSAYSWSVRYSEWNVGGKLVPSYPILDQMNQVLRERRELYRDMLEIIGSSMCAGSNSFLQEEIGMYLM